MGFGVWGLGFGVWGLGFGVWGLGFRGGGGGGGVGGGGGGGGNFILTRKARAAAMALLGGCSSTSPRPGCSVPYVSTPNTPTRRPSRATLRDIAGIVGAKYIIWTTQRALDDERLAEQGTRRLPGLYATLAPQITWQSSSAGSPRRMST